MTTNQTPRLWLYCWDNTEWLETTYAVIDVTPAWAQATLARVHLMAGLRLESHGGLYQMEYWDATPTWVVRPHDLEDDDPREQLIDDVENHEAVYCPAGHGLWPTPSGDEQQSTECVTLRVQEDGIDWACHIKHSEQARLHTVTIPLRDLEHYARGETPEGATVIAYNA